jgi:hypothetical protein
MPTQNKTSRRRRQRRLAVENLESRNLFAGLPYGAMPDDTGEFMLGRVAVTHVLLESNGTQDASTENWTASQINDAKDKLSTGVNWWKDVLATKSSVHDLDFIVDNEFADTPVATRYEPISRVSNDYSLWVSEFLSARGFNQSANLETNMRAFNHAQRLKLNTDWAFTVFTVNSQADADGQFQTGGSFRRAFSFAGGLFMVLPSTRPASTFTHEIGHQFWARDEYSGGATYVQKRGYYDTQNTNAVDLNPDPNFQQQPSIMAAGTELDQAFASKVTAPQALAMIGWQDTDGDGIFDLLDVPLKLEGSGSFDSASRVYSFKGSARAVALPNANSSGLKNDITLNQVSRLEYSFDGTNWTTISSPNLSVASLDLSINVPQNQTGNIQIRAIDAPTGVTSNLFIDALDARPQAVSNTGISGYVWLDKNEDQTWQAGEIGRNKWQVGLVDQSGQPLVLRNSIEPDDKAVGRIASTAYAGVTLTSVGLDADGLGVATDANASTGTKVLRPFSVFRQDFNEGWSGDDNQLRVDFNSPTTYVSVDVIGLGIESFGRLELYDSNSKLLDRVTSPKLTSGSKHTLELGRASADIHHVIIRGHMSTSIKIDNLKFGPASQATTDASGYYAFPYLAAGTYNVQVTPRYSGFEFINAVSGKRQVSLVGGQPKTDLDFAVLGPSSQWQNQLQREDTDNSGSVVPRDVLLIITQINSRGSGPLTGFSAPPFVDTDGNGVLAPVDVLIVISYINANGSGGEGENGPQSVENELIPPDGAVSQVDVTGWVDWTENYKKSRKSTG